MTSTVTYKIPDPIKYVELKPFIDEDGIYMPVEPYGPEGMGVYRQVISKELFVEAYNKWIKEATDA